MSEQIEIETLASQHLGDRLEIEALAFLHGGAPLTGPPPKLPGELGRKPIFTHDLAEKICERLVNGESLRSICADPAMPSKATVLRWARQNPDFQRLYAFALHSKFDGMGEEIIQITDDPKNYTIEATDLAAARSVLAKEASDADAAAQAEVTAAAVTVALIGAAVKLKLARVRDRIDYRKWTMAKELPRKYGDLPALEPPPVGEDAKVVNPSDPKVIENDPMHDALNAWSKVKGA